MSQAIYCHHCAAKLIPNAKFCNQCGTSLASLSNKPEPPPQPKPARPVTFTPFVANGQDDDDSPYDHMDRLNIQMDRLEVEVSPYRHGVEKLGAVANSGPVQIERRDGVVAGKLTKRKQQEFLKQYGNEAGANPVKPGQSTTVGGE